MRGISCQILLPGGSLFPDMFCNFYFVKKNHKIAKSSTSTKVRSTYLESLGFFDAGLTKFKKSQILLNKISY